MSGKLTRAGADAAAQDMLARLDAPPDDLLTQQIAAFTWHGMVYLGRIAWPYPEKPYIVYVSKSEDPVNADVASAIRRRRDIPLLQVNPRVEFHGVSYMLGLSGETLCVLSGEDVLYCHVHPRQPAGETFKTGTEVMGFENP